MPLVMYRRWLGANIYVFSIQITHLCKVTEQYYLCELYNSTLVRDNCELVDGRGSVHDAGAT